MTLIKVKVTPKSRKSEVIGWVNDELCVRVAAIPDKGQANAELIRFLAKQLKVGRNSISLVRGETSRHKQLDISELTLKEIESRLSPESDN